MIHPLIQPIFRIQIRPTTGRLLQMRTASPLRGVWVSTMAVSAAAVGRATTMSGAWGVGFDDGGVGGSGRSGDYYVRCVRGGQ